MDVSDTRDRLLCAVLFKVLFLSKVLLLQGRSPFSSVRLVRPVVFRSLTAPVARRWRRRESLVMRVRFKWEPGETATLGGAQVPETEQPVVGMGVGVVGVGVGAGVG